MSQSKYIQEIIYERTKEKFTLVTPRLKSDELTWDCVRRVVKNFPFSSVVSESLELQRLCVVDDDIVLKILDCFEGNQTEAHLIFAQNVSVAINVGTVFATYCYKKQSKRDAERSIRSFRADLVEVFMKLSNASKGVEYDYAKQLVVDALKIGYGKQYELNLIAERFCDYMPTYADRLYHAAKAIDVKSVLNGYGSKPKLTHIDCVKGLLQSIIQAYHLCFDEIPSATASVTESNKKGKFITIVEVLADLGVLKKSLNEDLGQDALGNWVKTSVRDYKKSLG